MGTSTTTVDVGHASGTEKVFSLGNTVDGRNSVQFSGHTSHTAVCATANAVNGGCGLVMPPCCVASLVCVVCGMRDSRVVCVQLLRDGRRASPSPSDVSMDMGGVRWRRRRYWLGWWPTFFFRPISGPSSKCGTGIEGGRPRPLGGHHPRPRNEGVGRQGGGDGRVRHGENGCARGGDAVSQALLGAALATPAGWNPQGAFALARIFCASSVSVYD